MSYFASLFQFGIVCVVYVVWHHLYWSFTCLCFSSPSVCSQEWNGKRHQRKENDNHIMSWRNGRIEVSPRYHSIFFLPLQFLLISSHFLHHFFFPSSCLNGFFFPHRFISNKCLLVFCCSIRLQSFIDWTSLGKINNSWSNNIFIFILEIYYPKLVSKSCFSYVCEVKEWKWIMRKMEQE